MNKELEYLDESAQESSGVTPPNKVLESPQGEEEALDGSTERHRKGIVIPTKVDLTSLISNPENFIRERGDNLHLINSISGLTVAILKKDFQKSRNAKFAVRIGQEGQSVLVQEDVPAEYLERIEEVPVSRDVVERICHRLMEGELMHKICGSDGVPSYSVVSQWRRHNQWVRTAIEQARADRAEKLVEKILEEAEAAEGKDPIDGARVRIDAYKYVAGLDNSRYSPKAKVEANINVPTQIIISTGIDRGEADAATHSRTIESSDD